MYHERKGKGKHHCCHACQVLQTELSPKKGNVYYDIKTTSIVKGIGIIPDEEKTTITKGKKLLKRQTSITICEAIVKYAKHTIKQKNENIRMRELLENPRAKREVINIRCETRAKRDLLQDLQDIREGICVIHDSDMVKETAQAKRDRKEKRIIAKTNKLQKRRTANMIRILKDKDESETMKHFAKKEVGNTLYGKKALK